MNRGPAGNIAFSPDSSCKMNAEMDKIRSARYQIGQVVRHRLYPFRGVVFDIDPIFANTEEWYQAIPAEVRPHKDQPFYHLFAENDETEYVAYVSEQNLIAGRDRRAGAPSASRRNLHQGRQRRLPSTCGVAALERSSFKLNSIGALAF